MQRFKASSFRRSSTRREATRRLSIAGSLDGGELGDALLQQQIPEDEEGHARAHSPPGYLHRSGTGNTRTTDRSAVPKHHLSSEASLGDDSGQGMPQPSRILTTVTSGPGDLPPLPPNHVSGAHAAARLVLQDSNTHRQYRHVHGSASPSPSPPPRRDPPTTKPSDLRALSNMLTSSYINLLLLCVPLGLAAGALRWGAVTTFTLNFLALIPLALILGDVTEDLALRFGDVVGGLLNATFGNVVEIILSISALQRGLYTVVSTSLLGSILSNLLLVLGCCMAFGGYFYKTQHFNEVGNRTCSALLFLSCIGIILPTAASKLIDSEDDESILAMSRGTCLILISCYVAYLVFQLHSHREMFSPGDEDGEQPIMSLTFAMLLLTGITVVVALASEYLTGSLEEVSQQTNLGEAFLGMIVLPIAGNACEHLTAITVAMKNKMDLALGVAVGSSIQIALFAIPLAVLVAWAQGIPFSLNFDAYSALALTLSVAHANNVTNDAMSHWLLGVQLIAVYCIIALTYLYRS